MNINTGVMSLNVNNVLVKRQLDKEQTAKVETSALKINENIEVKEKESNMINENLVAAESNITNIVEVEDLLKQTKDNILQQSAMAMLSQANKNSADVMTLLS